MATREGHEVSVTTTGRSDLSAATSAGQGYPGQHHNPSVGSGSTGGGTSGTTGGASTGGSGGGTVNLTTEQRTQAVTTLRGANIQAVEGVTVTVGQPLPSTVRLVECPETLRSLITGVRECRIVRVGNTYYVVEGGSRTVVTTIAAQ